MSNFIYHFDIRIDDNQQELINLVNRTVDKIKHELNGDTALSIRRWDGQYYSSKDSYGSSQPIDKLSKLLSLDMFKLDSNHVLTITLTIY